MKKILKWLSVGLSCTVMAISFAGCGGSAEPPHEHAYTQIETVAATCQEIGYEKHICSCGDYYVDNETSYANHSGKVKCSVCNLDYFEELKSLTVQYGSLGENGIYTYIGTPYDGVFPAIVYNTSEGSISLMTLNTVLDTDFIYSLSIPHISNGTGLREGKYIWLLLVGSDSALGVLDANLFSDYTSSLKITTASGISSSQYSNISSIAASYTKIVLKYAFVPLLEKSTKGIKPVNFGFYNY